MSLSGNLNVAGTLTTVNITSTNMVETNITTATLLATTSISTGLLNATNSTVTNVVHTTLSSGNAFITTALTSANIFISGVSNLNGNSNTIGSIFTTGGNVGVGTVTPSYKLHVSGDIYASGDITAFSDIRLKENIVELSGCLDKIDYLRGVSFDRIDTGTKHIGLIAQEVETQFPELVATNKNDGFKSVNYGNTVAVLLECIKELKTEISDLKNRITVLESV